MAGTNTPSETEARNLESDAQASGQGNKRSGGSWNRTGQKGGQTSITMYNFEGAKTEIGAVLGLKHERMKNKVIFDDFMEKFVTYLTSNMTGAKDVVKMITDRDDMLDRIDEDMPDDLTAEESL